MISPNLLALDGHVSIVTGAASGIGRGAALQLAAQGASVALLDMNEEGLADTANTIHGFGGSAFRWTVDVSDVEALQSTINAAVTHFGRLDSLVANAGINGVWGPIDKITPDDYDRTMDTNLRATFFAIQAAVAHMKERGGSIIVTSSINGTRTFNGGGMTVYATSKGGQAIMAKILANELGPFGIRVNVIVPGSVTTNIGTSTSYRGEGPIGRPKRYPEGYIPLTGWENATTDQLGQAILFLVSGAATHISGTELIVDGAQSLLN